MFHFQTPLSNAKVIGLWSFCLSNGIPIPEHLFRIQCSASRHVHHCNSWKLSASLLILFWAKWQYLVFLSLLHDLFSFFFSQSPHLVLYSSLSKAELWLQQTFYLRLRQVNTGSIDIYVQMLPASAEIILQWTQKYISIPRFNMHKLD